VNLFPNHNSWLTKVSVHTVCSKRPEWRNMSVSSQPSYFCSICGVDILSLKIGNRMIFVCRVVQFMIANEAIKQSRFVLFYVKWEYRK